MKRILTMTAVLGVCALLGSTAAAAQSGTTQPGDATTPSTGAAAMESRDDNQPSRSARNFVEEAAADSTAEVKLGELAQQKASSEDVKEFAQRMVDDHTKANEQLTQVASQHNITPPQELTSKHQKLHDKLSKLSGDEFDREYMKAMVKDHEKAVKLFRKQAGRSNDGALSQFASSTLPKLEEHLEEARRIREGLNEGARGTSGTSDTTGTSGTTGTGRIDDDGPESPGGDDVNNPGHSEPPPSTPNPDPTQRP